MVVRTLLAACGLLLALAAASAPAQPAGFAADFVQTRLLPGFAEPLVSHGRLEFGATGGFRWEITRPYHYVFAMDGERAREELPDGTTRELAPEETPWLAVVERVFVTALSGDEAALARHFRIEATTEADGRRLVLEPRSEAMREVIRRIEVEEAAPGRPRQLRIDEAAGGEMEIRFAEPAADGHSG